MTMHRSSATSVLIVFAIALSVVLLFARAFGDSIQDSTTDKGTLSAQSPASAAERDLDLRLVTDTVASLRGIHIASTDANIPLAARPFLTTLKHQLRDLITNRLGSENNGASTEQLQARLIVDLSRYGVIVTEPACETVDQNYVDTGYDYGDIYDITIKRHHDCVDLIAVTITLGVLCGQDTALTHEKS